MRPIIGITSRYLNDKKHYNLPDAYTKAVQRNGGTPIILPPLYEIDQDQLLGLVDGIIFTGGPDVDPLLYGEEPLPKQGSIDILRDTFEFSLAKKALAGNKPVFGICRGLQVLNAAAGGTLIQDIGSQISKPLKHWQETEAWYGTHHLNLDHGSLVHEIFGKDRVKVNTFHHQACKTPAPGFKVTGRAPDGVNEVLEVDSPYYRLCVQWHPEHMHKDEMNKLFSALIEASK